MQAANLARCWLSSFATPVLSSAAQAHESGATNNPPDTAHTSHPNETATIASAHMNEPRTAQGNESRTLRDATQTNLPSTIEAAHTGHPIETAAVASIDVNLSRTAQGNELRTPHGNESRTQSYGHTQFRQAMRVEWQSSELELTARCVS